MYHQIARNKRKSVIVIAIFFLFWMAIGYGIGFIAGGVGGGVSGAIIAAVLALLAVLWSLTLGQATVLSVSGAREVSQHQAPVLYDIVSTLPTGAGWPESSSRGLWRYAVSAAVAPQEIRSQISCGEIPSKHSLPAGTSRRLMSISNWRAMRRPSSMRKLSSR